MNKPPMNTHSSALEKQSKGEEKKTIATRTFELEPGNQKIAFPFSTYGLPIFPNPN